MSRRLAIGCLGILVLFSLVSEAASSQSRPELRMQAADGRSRPAGFLDYALGKINPNDTDYGGMLHARRHAMVEHTIDDLYFWSNVVTLILLTGMEALVFHQWRAAEMIAASLIAQLWNGRVSDGIEIERRTEQFNQLVAVHNAETERSLASRSHADGPSELKRTVEALERRGPKGVTSAGVEAPDRPDGENAVAPSSDSNAYGLQQRNLMLERQVEALRNTEANLRKRLNDTMGQVEQERNRNQTLKGA